MHHHHDHSTAIGTVTGTAFTVAATIDWFRNEGHIQS